METLATPQIQIRPVRPEDLSAVSRIEDSTFKDPYPPYFLTQLAEANADTFVVALDRGEMVGYAVVDQWTDGQHLVSIAVLDDHRRSGVGQALLNDLLGRLREGRLGLELRRSNQEALSFYQKNGFRQTGIAHSYYKDGEDAIQMEKMITKKVEILAPA
jgi:[ribosomal protein S18]-alanine N-acetyltransferase